MTERCFERADKTLLRQGHSIYALVWNRLAG